MSFIKGDIRKKMSNRIITISSSLIQYYICMTKRLIFPSRIKSFIHKVGTKNSFSKNKWKDLVISRNGSRIFLFKIGIGYQDVHMKC
jgi:hypothetical protein